MLYVLQLQSTNERQVWEYFQRWMRQASRKRTQQAESLQMFSALLGCSDGVLLGVRLPLLQADTRRKSS